MGIRVIARPQNRNSAIQQVGDPRYSRGSARIRPVSALLRTFVCVLSVVAIISSTPALSGAATLETRYFRLSIQTNGHCEILDKEAQVAWGSLEAGSPFGTVAVKTTGQNSRLVLGPCEFQPAKKSSELVAVFHPIANDASKEIRGRFQILNDQRTVQFSFEANPGLEIQSISPLANLLAITDSAKGYVIVPTREGLLIPADSGLSFSHRFDTYAYEGCHMEMMGLVQNSAALLVNWSDPYAAVDIKSGLQNNSTTDRQRIAASLALSKSAKSFQLHILGRGDYVSIAKAYRNIAKENGLLVTWDEKLKTNPERAKLFGAANIKLWSTLDRRMNEESTHEESVRVNWTFDEAAQVAEHLKKDLQLDRVLFTVGGWIHRGYDNQHPDILPTAPECGGDAAFRDCARRVMQLGYLFCLHDNYQDIYRDSPSWDERFIMKTADGKLARGGHWAGGVAFLTCSKMALELAERPQNLRAVKKLSNANAYFIDTTYAAGLQECFDKNHPLTRAEDIQWKQALSDYAREIFGVFGSECGREWAIPHSDFFEGLTGVSGRYYHDTNLPDKLGACVVPLFDLVYRDCMAMYGKYGYDPSQAAQYVLQHISLARPLNYHSIQAHLYWKNGAEEKEPLGLSPSVAEFTSIGKRQFKISYKWRVEKAVSEPWQVFVHFTDASGNIKFQNDHQPRPPITEWQPGEVGQGPFTATVPEGLTGPFEIRIGLFQPTDGRRALLRGRRNRDRSYVVGKLLVDGDQIQFTRSDEADKFTEGLDLFTRSDNGWAAGLYRMDCFIKNTYEILSPLNELTARLQMFSHEFLTADRKVQRTVFGQDKDKLTVIVNGGDSDYVCSCASNEQVRLPSLGFLIESPTFVAFYSRNWAGLDYTSPPLFTLRALDNRPLSKSRKIRVFHAFGDEKIRFPDGTAAVRREAVIDPKLPASG